MGRNSCRLRVYLFVKAFLGVPNYAFEDLFEVNLAVLASLGFSAILR